MTMHKEAPTPVKVGLWALLFGVILCACLHFTLSFEHYRLFPNYFVLTDLLDVRRVSPAAAIADHLQLWKGNTAGLHDIQIAKFHLGCYGNTDDVFKTKAAFESALVTGNSETFDKLTELQYDNTKFHPRSVCTCIDQTLKPMLDESVFTSTTVEAASSISSSKPWKVVWDEYKNTGLGWTNMKQRPQYQAHPADSDYDTTNDFEKHVIEFCSLSSMPQLTSRYEGILNAEGFMFASIFIIIAAILEDCLCGNVFASTGPDKKGIWLPQITKVLSSVFYFVGFVLFFVYSMLRTDKNKVENLAYRYGLHTNWQPFAFFTIIYLVVLITFLMWLFMMAKTFFGNHKPDYKARYSKTVMVEVLYVCGWTLYLIGVAVQSQITNRTSLFTIVIVVAASGALGVFSNILKIVYDKICVSLDPATVQELQTKEEPTLPSAKEARRILRHIGFTRLFIFITVVLLSLVLITSAEEDVANIAQQSWYDGRFVYAVLAFLVTGISIDVLLEIMPLQFDTHDDRVSTAYYTKYYITSIYFLWTFSTSYTYTQHNLSSHYQGS